MLNFYPLKWMTEKPNWLVFIVVLCLTGTIVAQEPKPQRIPVIEAHAHLSYGAAPAIARVMETNGIRWMVNLSGGSPGRGMEQAVRLAEQMPGKVVNFYNPDWSRIDEPDFAELETFRMEIAAKRFGYRGLKISKHLGLGLRWKSGVLVDIDDPVLDPIWKKAGELNWPVAIHTGDPKAFFEPLTPDNERWDELKAHPSWSFAGPEYPRRAELLAARDRVVGNFPQTVFICVHFGNNPEDIDYVDSLLDRFPNVVLDIAARVGEIGRHDAQKVRQMFVKHQDRILFGTDIGIGPHGLMLGSNGEIPPTYADIKPFYDAHWRFLESNDRQIDHPSPIQGNWKVDSIGLPREVLEKLYARNASKLLGLPLDKP
ncbi:MAG: amidohydrolase family protein [Myxococcales bacterium]|nr:amidohydrolase family protein [Myxococcales bacterium]